MWLLSHSTQISEEDIYYQTCNQCRCCWHMWKGAMRKTHGKSLKEETLSHYSFSKKKKSPCFKVSNGFFCCLGFFRPIGRLIIRLTKCLPGGTAVEENFINPISYWSSWEKSCRFVQKFSYLWLHWCKFFSGSLAINTSVSN